jgi:hypothetical protein
MDAPTSEIGYTPAINGRGGDHEVYMDMLKGGGGAKWN